MPHSSELQRTQLVSFPDELFRGKNIEEKSIRVAAEIKIQVIGDVTELWTSS